MQDFFPDHWSTLYLGLIFSITLAQMLVVYDLSNTTTPPSGLGMFSVYAMATLLGWILFSLQQGVDTALGISVTLVAWVINAYLLYLAASQRALIPRGRVVLGVLCLLGCLSALFLDERELFTLSAILASLCFASAGLLFAIRGFREHNSGDAIMCIAVLLMVVGAQISLYQMYVDDDYASAQLVVFGTYTWAYVLVVIGFLASVLMEYRLHLSHLATTDPLTKLFNRRGLETSLQVTLARSRRDNTYTAAILLDIDKFQQINDSFGHETGDKIICMVAESIARSCRSSDVVARIGGEEFLMVLPDTRLELARNVAERLRANLAEHPLWVDRQRIPLSVSLGVAGLRGEHNLDQLQREADRAMQLAKRNGRNRVAWVDNQPVHLSNQGA